MKVALLHTGYFIALIVLAFLSFLLILGAGFVGKMNSIVLGIPLVFSVCWLSDYTWRILSTNPDKMQLVHPAKKASFISLFISGILVVHTFFLTTIIPTPIESAPSWMFLGTSTVLLLIWYWQLYRYVKDNAVWTFLNGILLLVSLIYLYQIWSFLLANT